MFRVRYCDSESNNAFKFCLNCRKSVIKVKFIELMRIDIKISNIKNFGISSSKKYYKSIRISIYKKDSEYSLKRKKYYYTVLFRLNLNKGRVT